MDRENKVNLKPTHPYFVAGVVLLIATFAVAFFVLPFHPLCRSIKCGTKFGSGTIEAFGSDDLTWPQAIIVSIGVITSVASMVLGWVAVARRPSAVGTKDQPS